MPIDSLPAIEAGVLHSDCYTEINPHVDFNAHERQYIKLCKEVAELEDLPGLAGKLASTLRLPGATSVAKLKLLCKDHKIPIEWRIVHGGGSYAYYGLGRWVAWDTTE